MKYVLCPGYVRSTHDSQWHYIGTGRLMHLYALKPSQCVVFDPDLGSRTDFPPEWPRLGPRRDGNYSLETA